MLETVFMKEELENINFVTSKINLPNLTEFS